METIWINGDEYFWTGKKEVMHGGMFYLWAQVNNSTKTRWTQRAPQEFDNEYKKIA